MPKLVVAVVLAFAAVNFTSSARAQMIYEPVQYQYGSCARFYYGGSNPVVIAEANDFDRLRAVSRAAARYPDPFGKLATPSVRIYSDLFPFQNAALFGYIPMDAMNEAYGNVPRYFRKVDLLRAAVPQADGSLVVPPQLRLASGAVINPAKPASPYSAGTILIIPKRQPASHNQVASAS